MTSESGPGVLVVDDDAAILRLYSTVLDREGYRVVSTTCPKHALELVEKQRFDLVICDINMPEVSGLDIIRKLRTRDQSTSAIIVTAAPNVASAVEAIELGTVRYLMKPVSFDDLRNATRMGCAASVDRRKKEAAVQREDRQDHERGALDKRVTEAITKLRLVYQPIVRYSTQSTIAFELLMRGWEGNFSNPLELIGAAEELGRERELRGHLHVLSAELPARYPAGADIYINIAPSDLADESFYAASYVLRPLAARIVLELTERTSLSAVKDPERCVRRLKEAGFRVAVDDLGAGYSGLNTFAKIQPDVVKVDMALVRDVDRKPAGARIVRSLSEAARDLGALLVCEGVETPGELEALVNVGCDVFQGYLFGRPVDL